MPPVQEPVERDIEAAEPQSLPVRYDGNLANTSSTPASDKSEPPGQDPAGNRHDSGDNKPAKSMAQRVGGGCFGGDDDDDERGAMGTGKPILIEFRDFILGGNLIRMAVAFILALSLNELVKQFVASFVTPILGIIGAADFTDLKFTIRNSAFEYGKFLNTAIFFVVICCVLFFCLILPVQRYGGRCVPSWIIRKCPFCFSDMPAIATKCAHCTSTIIPLVKPLKTPTQKKA